MPSARVPGAPRPGDRMAEAKAPTAHDPVGPPMVILGAGFALGAASILLLLAGGGSVLHLVGYLTGSVIPVLLIGVFRRSDLDRRRSPYYASNRFVRPA